MESTTDRNERPIAERITHIIQRMRQESESVVVESPPVGYSSPL